MRPLPHLLRYEGLEPIAAKLGDAIAKQLVRHADLPEQLLVVPVPLFGARQKQRGFNQSELLASAAVGAMRRLRPEWRGQLAARVLRRSRATQSQAGLSLPERRRNLRGAFFVADADAVRGRDVLLIDDTDTTGATARAGSWVLKRPARNAMTRCCAINFRRRVRSRLLRRNLDMSNDVAFWGSKTH